MIYAPHPDDPSKTLLRQETAIEVKTVAMTSYLESIALDNVIPNVQKGRRAMEWVIDNFHSVTNWHAWVQQAERITDEVKSLGIKGIRDVEAHMEKVQTKCLLESENGELR